MPAYKKIPSNQCPVGKFFLPVYGLRNSSIIDLMKTVISDTRKLRADFMLHEDIVVHFFIHVILFKKSYNNII